MAHIGNVNPHLPQPFVELFNGKGIVKIFRIVGVNGASERRPKVLPLGNILWCNLSCYLVSGLFHRFWVDIGQSILRQNGVHLGVVIACLTYHIHHFAHQILVFCVGPLRDFHNRFVVGFSTFQLAFRNDNVACKDVFGRDEIGKVLTYTQFSYELIFLSLQDFNHLCLFDVMLSARHETHFHAISVGSPQRIAFRNENRCAAIIGQKSILAICFAQECPLLHLPFRVEFVGTIGHFHQKIIPCHLLNHVDSQHFQGVRVELQRTENLFKTQCSITLRREKRLQSLLQLLSAHALSTFFPFSHILIFLFLFFTQRNKKETTKTIFASPFPCFFRIFVPKKPEIPRLITSIIKQYDNRIYPRSDCRIQETSARMYVASTKTQW